MTIITRSDKIIRRNSPYIEAEGGGDWDSSQALLYSPLNEVVSESAVSSNATAMESEGWSSGKGENYVDGSGTAPTWQNGGVGSIYTVSDSDFRTRTNYQGVIPRIESGDRVGCFESNNEVIQVQTDHYLDFQDQGNPNVILPPDVWFSFWIYPNRYGSEMSEFYARVGKWLYPCLGGHGSCTTMAWLLYFIGHGPTPDDGMELTIRDPGSATGITLYSEVNPDNFGALIQTDTSDWIRQNRWNNVKIHINSGNAETGNQIEAWIRGLGGSDTKVMDYYAHTDPNQRLPDSTFLYQIPDPAYRVGHDNFRLCTTFPGNNAPANSRDVWLYVNDFIIAGSESGLPNYSY